MSSLRRRIASRLRFRDYIKQHRAGSKPASTAGVSGACKPPTQQRSLTRSLSGAVPASDRLPLDDYALALVGASIATILKLIPPMVTKAVIDYVILGTSFAGTDHRRGAPSCLPQSPKALLIVLVGLVLVVSVLGKPFGLSSRCANVDEDDQESSGRESALGKVYEHAMRLPLHRVYQLKSGGASSLLRRGCRGVGASWIFSMLYNPWQVQWSSLHGRDWSCARLGRLATLAGARFLLVPGVYYSDLLWNRRIRPLFRDVSEKEPPVEIDSARR